MSSPIITITTNIPMPFMLDADGRSLLESVARLLMRIQQPTLMARAQLEGYTTEEHQVGWRAFVEAAGGNTTVELNVASGVMQSADALVTQRRNSILQQLDGMENTWFPRLRAIIRRVLADDPSAAAFEAAFFEEMEQQPLGPGVIASMAKFVNRIRSLDTTPGSPGARVRAVLNERGLTDERLAEVSAMVEELQAFDSRRGQRGPAHRRGGRRDQRAPRRGVREGRALVPGLGHHVPNCLQHAGAAPARPHRPQGQEGEEGEEGGAGCHGAGGHARAAGVRWA
jgi:hypothetical protein